MALRFAQVKTEYHLLVSIANCVWGSNRNRLSRWKLGERLVVLVKKDLGVLVKVAGPSFYSEEILWEDNLYPYRIPIEICSYYNPVSRLNCSSDFKDIFEDAFIKLGFQLMTQNLFPEYAEKEILKRLMAVSGMPLKKETLISELNKERSKTFGEFGKNL